MTIIETYKDGYSLPSEGRAYPNYKGRMPLDGLLWLRRIYCEEGFDLPSDLPEYFLAPITLREVQRRSYNWEQFSLGAFLRSSECLSGQ